MLRVTSRIKRNTSTAAEKFGATRSARFILRLFTSVRFCRSSICCGRVPPCRFARKRFHVGTSYVNCAKIFVLLCGQIENFRFTFLLEKGMKFYGGEWNKIKGEKRKKRENFDQRETMKECRRLLIINNPMFYTNAINFTCRILS